MRVQGNQPIVNYELLLKSEKQLDIQLEESPVALYRLSSDVCSRRVSSRDGMTGNFIMAATLL